MSTIHTRLVDEERHLSDQYALKCSIQSLAVRWRDLLGKSDELTPKYDRQYSAWLLFESELNSFRDQIIAELEQRVQTMIATHESVDLTRMNQLLNDLRVSRNDSFD